jgi:beta-lactamase regulating signal transducer with metallopeptidase domain
MSLDAIFTTILNMSITSSYVIVGVIILRFFLKKTPKKYSYALWSFVLIRLISPVFIKTRFSFLSFLKPNKTVTHIPYNIGYMDKPKIDVGINSVSRAISDTLPESTPQSSVNPLQVIMAIMEFVWIIGIIFLVIYAVISYIKIARRISTATHVTENIFETDMIDTPFIFGLVYPKIYIPTNLAINKLDYILLHEKTHIQRYDHVIKTFSYLVLIIHWFNPLVWIAFILMTKDMEMSCDECVIEKMGKQAKANYATYLLSFAIDEKKIGNVIPLAFGENNLKTRIKNIMNYKKRGFWITIACVIIVIIAGVIFITNPKTKAEPKSYEETLYSYKTPYVGDNSKVSNIVQNLPLPEGYVYNGIELQTNKKPYGVTVKYKHESKNVVTLDGDSLYNLLYRNSIIMFSLIENVDYIEFKSEINTKTFTKDMADELIGKDVYSLSKDIDTFKQFINTLAIDTSLKNSMKGLELYVWKNKELTKNNDIYFTLLIGTNVNKTEEQIYDINAATNDMNKINAMLSEYTGETYLSVQYLNIDNFTRQEIEEITQKIQMHTRTHSISMGPTNDTMLIPQDGDDTVTTSDKEIGDTVEDLLKIICSSPSHSSATSAYVKEHQNEYDKIVSMGIPALDYITTILEKDDYGLRGNIAYLLSEDIYATMNNDLVNLSDKDKVALFDARKIIDDWIDDMGYPTKDNEKTK